MGYLLTPIKINTPFISRRAVDVIDCVRAKGQDFSDFDHLLDNLVYHKMCYYASLSSCLQRNACDLEDWLDCLDQEIRWRTKKVDYLVSPLPKFDMLLIGLRTKLFWQ
ncbi:hypothetical protein DFH28DRAFT_901684 [Melampsora americana]|nr:hypothetical protein DFH28DRAFT_901684 [Melampsora americana]